MTSTRAPAGLQAAGRALWRRIMADLGDGWELDARELLILEAAARQADQNSALETAIAADGVTVTGSMGQSRLNAALTEARQGRVALERLLASLALPGEDGQTQTAAQRRAQAAAGARWMREGKRKERRRGAA